MDDARIFEAHHHAHGLSDFLFALAWSETDRDKKLFEEKARAHFADIARIMGYRLEDADTKVVGFVPALTTARRPDMSRKSRAETANV
jgi:hypothetical protein